MQTSNSPLSETTTQSTANTQGVNLAKPTLKLKDTVVPFGSLSLSQ
jgi:hypothetical protein